VLVGSPTHRYRQAANRLQFTGRLIRHALAPGRYLREATDEPTVATNQIRCPGRS
jgi:hypothetical protein